jgi:G8 domain/Fibronectin type III domain
MILRPTSLLLASLFFLTASPAAIAQTCQTPQEPPTFPPAPAGFTHTAVADGNWNDPNVWLKPDQTTHEVPGNNAIVSIPLGRRVTVTSQETSRLRFIQVNGELRMWIHSSTRLFVDTVFVAGGGLFVIGDPVNTVKPGVVAELVFISWDSNPIKTSWAADASEKSRGLIAAGSVHVYGEPKTHMVPMTANALKNATSITVATAPTNWKVGDTIVLTGSYFREVGGAEPVGSSQDEKLTITSISGNVIGFAPALAWDHIRPIYGAVSAPKNDLRLHVANLTRNIVFRSESTSIPLRGHIMLMNRDVDIRHVSLINLGRTDKRVPLDDFIVTRTADGLDYSIAPNTGTVNNRRGRYSLHVHRNGTLPGSAPPSKVYNSVVNGTVGWGFVSHSSHVDFQNNVAYDFSGAGFVTEAGDELGNFDNNIAIRGTGNGEYRTNRIVFANLQRPQPLSDFAFSGDGFWFQGPAVRARNNVAAGCDGAGMIWFTTGAPNVDDRFPENGLTHDRYSSFPRCAISTVYAGFPDLSSNQRYWDHSTNNEKVVISDLPILECDGFESYGNLVGFRLRFNNFNNNAWYGEDPFNFDSHIRGTATLMRQKIKNLKLWNNELGFRANYTSLGDWTNVANVNRLDYNNGQSSYIGAEIDFVIKQSTFNTLTIDGYEVAGKTVNCSNNSRTDLTFTGRTYFNYANFDTWNMDPACTAPTTCAMPSGLTVNFVSTSSRTISWTPSAGQKRFLVRYRANGDQQWKLIDTAGSSVTLSNLAGGVNYTYQVIAGCMDTVSGNETAPSAYTQAATFQN